MPLRALARLASQMRVAAGGSVSARRSLSGAAGGGGSGASLLRTFRAPARAGSLLAATLLGGARPAAAASFASASVIDQVTFKQWGMLSWLIIDVAIQWGGWAVSALLKTEKFYDLLGTGSFAALAVGSLLTAQSQHARKIVATVFVAAWALRLGGFLVLRVLRTGHDSRFDEAKHKPLTFWVYWTMQAVWVYTTLLPVLLLNTTTAGGPSRLLWSDVVGGAVYAAGLVLEATADGQKFAFKQDPANRGKFIDSGLWSLSRYPNYCGEMLVWWGMFVFASGGLSGPQLASVASPLFVMLLLRFVSGVPLQEKQAQQRWGTTQEYQDYVARTNLLLPLPRRGDARRARDGGAVPPSARHPGRAMSAAPAGARRAGPTTAAAVGEAASGEDVEASSLWRDLPEPLVLHVLSFLPPALQAWTARLVCKAARERFHGATAVSLRCPELPLAAVQEAWRAVQGDGMKQRQLASARVACGDMAGLAWLHGAGCAMGSVGWAAAEHGQLAVLEWARDEGLDLGGVCNAAAVGGQLAVLRWARAQAPPLPWGGAECHNAARRGDLEMLRWARAQAEPMPLDELTCETAAAAGQLEVLRWLRAGGCPWWRSNCEVCAAHNGHEAVVAWIRAQPAVPEDRL
ncbi:hypothetical protein HT031_003998 [Scenedesmus sp. PABB004]|nr:hypothetical protein HT031_003998 [Scenedesmus sp. PABB004]